MTGAEFAKHGTVKHSAKEYVRDEVHTNTLENAFSVFKRGMVGVYQHCGGAHLQLLAKIESKRLTYRRIGETSHT